MNSGRPVPVAGLLLAAGAGRRYGGPKALVGGWLVHGAGALGAGGCDPVIVVLGAGADDARQLVPNGTTVVVARDWQEGMAASLRAGLEVAGSTDAQAAMIHLVDLPDVGSDVVSRLRAHGQKGVLARATYLGVPGHPVLVGRDHWSGFLDSAVGDQGGRSYLHSHGVRGIECGDLAGGRDIDRPDSQPTVS